MLETEEDAREFYKSSKLDMMIINGINSLDSILLPKNGTKVQVH